MCNLLGRRIWNGTPDLTLTKAATVHDIDGRMVLSLVLFISHWTCVNCLIVRPFFITVKVASPCQIKALVARKRYTCIVIRLDLIVPTVGAASEVEYTCKVVSIASDMNDKGGNYFMGFCAVVPLDTNLTNVGNYRELRPKHCDDVQHSPHHIDLFYPIQRQ